MENYLNDKFTVCELAGITKVVTKKAFKIKATKDKVLSIIEDVHKLAGHKGERKTHLKITENYANVPRAIISNFIK